MSPADNQLDPAELFGDTLVRFMKPIHHWLCRKNAAYRKWHQFKYHKHFHWAALVLAIFCFGLGSWIVLRPSTNLQAATVINSQLPFQGRLTNSDGTVVADGNYDVVFKIYDDPTAGNTLWTENHTSSNHITTSKGIFNTMLGSITAFGALNYNSDLLYLGIKVGSDAEMTPRIRLGAAPYAMNSNQLNGLSSTSFTILAGQAGGQTIDGGTAASENLTLSSTANATKGKILFGTSGYDEANNRLGVGNASPSAALDVTGTIAGTSSLTLGAASGTTGSLLFKGTTSGTVTVTPAAAAGTWSLTLPTTGGTSNYVLSTTDGAGTADWISGQSIAGLTTSSSPQFGHLGLGTAAVTGVALKVAATTSGVVSQYGMYMSPTFGSGGTTAGYGIYVLPATAAASFTQAGTYGLYVADTTKGSGSTITTQYGLYIANQTQGGTNYSIYTGTAASYFGGTMAGASSLTLGAASGTTGSLLFKGTTSGTVTVTPAAAAGTWTLTVPATGGTTDYALATTDGSGTLGWYSGQSIAGLKTTSTPQFARLGLGVAADATRLLTSSDAQIATIYGSSTASGTLTLYSSSNATKGKILFGTSGYDEANNRLGIGTASPSAAFELAGNQVFSQGANRTISVAATTTNVVGNNLSITAGAAQQSGAASKNGGDLNLTAGAGYFADVPAVGGNVNITSGSTSGNSNGNTGGAITLLTAAPFNDQSGAITLETANSYLTPGAIVLNAGSSGAYATYGVIDLQQAGTSRLYVKSDGKVGIGNTSPGSALDVKGTFRLSGATSGYVGFAPAAAAGSTTYTLPSADGSANAALITSGAGVLSWSQAIGTASTPQFGKIGIGGAAATSVGVYAYGTPTTGVSQYGVDSNLTFGSDATTAGYSYISAPITTAASYTMSNLYGYYASDATKGSGSTITTQYGLYIANQTQGATNYSIYTGTAQSYFGGNVGIGQAPSVALDVKGSFRLNGATSGYVGFAPAAAAGTTTYTLPSADGTSGQSLSTNGSATLSWATNIDNSLANGRLTLTSGTPVTTSDVTGATTIYYSPYNGNRIALYVNSAWQLDTFSELSKALGTLTSGKNYDVFIYDNSGTATIDSFVAWTSDTARATAIVQQDGVWVKSGDATRRYLGTFRTTATTTTEDSVANRLVWNMNNRIGRTIVKSDTDAGYAYTTGSWRSAHADTSHRIGAVFGMAETMIDVTYNCEISSTVSQNTGSIGIGVDSTTAQGATASDALYSSWNSGTMIEDMMPQKSRYTGTPGLGYHYFQALEIGAAGITFYPAYGYNIGGLTGSITN